MILLSSPPTRSVSRYFSIGVGTLAALGIVFTGVVAFTQLPDAWQDPERAALYLVFLQIFIGLLGIIGAASQLTQQLTIGDPRQCPVTMEEIALAADGKVFVTKAETIPVPI